MSALRLGPGRYADPYTHEPFTVPVTVSAILPAPEPEPEPLPFLAIVPRTGKRVRTEAEIIDALREARGNKWRAARTLDVSSQGLYQRIEVMRAKGTLPDDVDEMVRARYRPMPRKRAEVSA